MVIKEFYGNYKVYTLYDGFIKIDFIKDNGVWLIRVD